MTDAGAAKPTPVAPLPPSSTIGIFGGGQLGRMLAMAAAELGLQTHIFSDTTGPACDVACSNTIAPYGDLDAVRAFAADVDVATFEFENVPLSTGSAAAETTLVLPGVKALEIAQDRLLEKTFISGLGIPVAPFSAVDDNAGLEACAGKTGLPAILKTRRLGYDGKGQTPVSTLEDLKKSFNDGDGTPCVLEARIDFVKEISVLVVRGRDGAIAFYDLPENTHKSGILDTSTVPADITEAVAVEARTVARQIAEALDYVGLLAIELFVLASQDAPQVMVNEIAPRVHNSGHWTSDACQVSQFENHIRAIAGWPLGATDRHSDARMTNLIGADANAWPARAAQPKVSLHLYGKRSVRPGRKMGHITEIWPISTPKPS